MTQFCSNYQKMWNKIYKIRSNWQYGVMKTLGQCFGKYSGVFVWALTEMA